MSIFTLMSALDITLCNNQIEKAIGKKIFGIFLSYDMAEGQAAIERALGQKVFNPYSLLDPILSRHQMDAAVASSVGVYDFIFSAAITDVFSTITINGSPFQAQVDSTKPYALKQALNVGGGALGDLYRFEIHSGDVANVGSERAELSGNLLTIPRDTSYWISCAVAVLPGAVIPAATTLFNVAGQNHQGGAGGNPDFYTWFQDDKWFFNTGNIGAPSANVDGQNNGTYFISPVVNRTSSPAWHNIVYNALKSSSGTADVLKVWYDGTQVYNQTGNIMQDHTTGIYFKYGIYRAPGSGGALPVQVHYYANVEYGTSSLLARVSSPIPFPVPTSFVPPPQTVINLGSQENFGLGTVTINTVLAAVAAGTLVVVFAVDENASITGATVTDSSGNTYTQITSVRVSATSYLQAFYSVLTNPLTNASTLSYHCAAGSGSFNVGLNASAVIGYSTLDSATTNTATSVGTPYSVTGAGPASVPNEIYFGFALSEGASITAPGGSWTRPPPAIIGVFVNTSAYQINSGTSALTFSGAAGSFGNGAIIVSFK